MLNPYAIQKKTLQYLNSLQVHINKLQKEVSFYILEKQFETNQELPSDVKKQCEAFLYGSCSKKQYKCKLCPEVFDDGRKLGGHNSRKHRNIISVQNLSDTAVKVQYINSKIQSISNYQRNNQQIFEEDSLSDIFQQKINDLKSKSQIEEQPSQI